MARQDSKNAAVSRDPADSLDPMRLLAQLPLAPYQTLADLRSGTGGLTVLIAKHTFSGKVYATDRSAAARDELKEKLAQVRLSNVVVYEPKDQAKVIPAESVDGVLLAIALSEADDKVAYLKKVGGLLKKGAWVAVIEWSKRNLGDGPPMEERISEAEVIELAHEGGFRFSERRDLDGSHYLVILRK
jgi:ubiquinone/menaquinone biosynthesis C-methylase UbiE